MCEVLQDGRASFAYARVRYSNDKESQREKFIFIVWIGPQCKIMRKAKVGLFRIHLSGCSKIDLHIDLRACSRCEDCVAGVFYRGSGGQEGRFE